MLQLKWTEWKIHRCTKHPNPSVLLVFKCQIELLYTTLNESESILKHNEFARNKCGKHYLWSFAWRCVQSEFKCYVIKGYRRIPFRFLICWKHAELLDQLFIRTKQHASILSKSIFSFRRLVFRQAVSCGIRPEWKCLYLEVFFSVRIACKTRLLLEVL